MGSAWPSSVFVWLVVVVSERLSDEELRSIAGYLDAIYLPAEGVQAQAYVRELHRISTGLVAEVRRLRAESDALVEAVREQAAHAASQEQVLRSEIDAARSHLEALVAERARSSS